MQVKNLDITVLSVEDQRLSRLLIVRGGRPRRTTTRRTSKRNRNRTVRHT